MARNSGSRFNPRPTDIIVAVMGMTGSGKSTFISRCTNKPVKIGHGLESCTEKVDVYRCRWDADTDIYLIDTPGFDDTYRSDTDVLKDIATWFTESYIDKIKLNGLVYLHRITDPRMVGSAKKNLFVFKKLCGPNIIKNILLVTTMWENVDITSGNNREAELTQVENFWGFMLQHGAQIARHDNSRDSAMGILSHFINKKRTTMAIQKEMVNDKKMLHETTAGQELDSELRAEKERSEKILNETKEEFRQALEEKDQEAAKHFREHEMMMTEKLQRIRKEREELKVSMEKMHESSAQRVKRLESKLEDQRRAMHRQAESAETAQKLQREMESQVGSLQKKMETRDEENERLRNERNWHRDQQGKENERLRYERNWYRDRPHRENMVHMHLYPAIPYGVPYIPCNWGVHFFG